MREQKNKIALGVAILAAGASRRMGQPKLLLPWGNTTVIGQLLQQWKRLGASQVAVVGAASAKPLLDELDRLEFPAANRIVNPAPERGMFSSIQCAANWAGWDPLLTHWLITLGDQPHLQDTSLRMLLNFSAGYPDKICQPLREERRKHPVLLPKQIFHELQTTRADDLKIFLVEHATELSGFQSQDVGLDFDIDTPEDYQHALKFAFPGGEKSTE